MSKRSGRTSPLARAAAQCATGAGVVRYIWEHPSNDGRRLRALKRAASYQVSSRLLGRRVVAQLGERSRLWVDPHRTAASMVLYANPPDRPEMLTWRRALGDGGLFIDVGANVGTYTLWAAEHGAEVIALEPAADTFALLRENITLNRYQVTALQVAAGDHCGTARFTAGLDAGNSLAADGLAMATLVTIDWLIGDRSVAGMKVDVEGFEFDVLRGAVRALTEHRIGLIQVEWNHASLFALGQDRRPIAQLLADYGYQLFRPDATGRLAPVADLGFGADVFAIPEPEGTLS